MPETGVGAELEYCFEYGDGSSLMTQPRGAGSCNLDALGKDLHTSQASSMLLILSSSSLSSAKVPGAIRNVNATMMRVQGLYERMATSRGMAEPVVS